MMELRRLTMVNWHLFDAEDIEVRGNFGILGENRSGKSTVLDMVQAVLTGASRTYMRLNAVAGEGGRGRSASKRSVLGYCLGTLGDGETRRSEAMTYVALGFEDRDGRRPPITIGLALEARSTDTSETVLGRFVVVGKLLTTADFTEIKDGSSYAAAWDDVRARLVADVGAANFINHRDKAIDFVREYMRRLVPGLPNAEPSAAALLKAVVNAMSLNQGYSATEFVRRFILEENPIRIGELRNSIETYRGVSATIVTMRRKLEALKELSEHVSAFAESLERKALEDWLAKRAKWLAARAANRAVREEMAAANRRIEAEREDREAALEGVREAKAEIERLNGAIAAHAAKSGRDQWAQSLKGVEGQAVMKADAIARRRRSAAILASAAMTLPAEIAAFCALAAASTAEGDLDGLRVAEQAFRDAAPASSARLAERLRVIHAQSVPLETEIEDLKKTLERAHEPGSQAYLSPPTKLLMRQLERAGMDARPLCDIVEIVDPEWVAAAEALLGRDREALLVERHRIGDATALFRDGRRDFRGASLVSLNKLDPSREAPRPGTFPSLFRTDDPDAMAFLQRRYGNVRLARTLAEFDLPGRSLMADGLYDDGLVRNHRHVDARDHKIGKAAQADLFRNLQDAYVEKGRALEGLTKEAKEIDRVRSALDVLLQDDGGSLSDLMADVRRLQVEKREILDKIAAIDAAGDGGLRERLAAQKAFQKHKEDELATIDERTSKYKIAVAVAERTLGGADGVEGSTMSSKLAKALYREGRKLFVYRRGTMAYRERLDRLHQDAATPAVLPAAEAAKQAARAHRKLAAAAIDAAGRAEQKKHAAELAARGKLRDYFNAFGVSAQVGPESPLLDDVKPWMDVMIADIEGNELRRYEERAREAAERAASLFRGEFVNALNMRVSKMERDIEALNRSLRDHPFHNEKYSFHRTAEAEFQPILKIIEISRISDEALEMLFRADVPDDFPHKDAIKAVEQLLEDPDKDFSAFEDYRNFHSFEIHMEDVVTKARTRWETRRSTGSGAEQQVPLYVAIGASLAAVYGSAGERGRPRGMSPALFDEAFSKMDGKNQRAMMAFYADLGLQVVIAAPLEKKAAIMGYMDTLVEVDRIGEQSTTDVVHVGKRAREALLAMNPEHLSDEQIADLMAAAE